MEIIASWLRVRLLHLLISSTHLRTFLQKTKMRMGDKVGGNDAQLCFNGGQYCSAI